MQFPTTRWDELAVASLHGDASARRALDEFCRRYWGPVHRFILRKGYPEAEAADLTQDFFLNFVESRSWRRADRERGKFRTFLLGALSHRLAKARAHRDRLKRGGGAEIVSLDEVKPDGADGGAVPPVEAVHFDREWALGILAAALAETRADYATRGKARHYDALKCFLSTERAAPAYEVVAAELEIGLGALKTEIFRLRGAFRAALLREVARTVNDPQQVQEELRYLRSVLASRPPESHEPVET